VNVPEIPEDPSSGATACVLGGALDSIYRQPIERDQADMGKPKVQ